MNTYYYVNEQMLGDTATEADAQRMVELLAALGYDVEYGVTPGQDDSVIAGGDWQKCLDIIAAEPNQSTE